MAQGRMLRKDICESDSFADLKDSNSQLLLCLLTIWWTDHGKMIGEEIWIKGNIIRKLKQFTLKEISRCLKNINDNTDVQWWIDSKGNKWLYWSKFDNHQTISNEKKAKDIYPSPKIPKSPQKNAFIREVKISKDNISSMSVTDADLILKTWNEKMPWKVNKITGIRLSHLKTRLLEAEFKTNFDTILTNILDSDFLMGKKPSKDHQNFKADFDWLIKNDTNYIKILEGKYKNDVKTGLSKFEVHA
jgi:hypothetical protein